MTGCGCTTPVAMVKGLVCITPSSSTTAATMPQALFRTVRRTRGAQRNVPSVSSPAMHHEDSSNQHSMDPGTFLDTQRGLLLEDLTTLTRDRRRLPPCSWPPSPARDGGSSLQEEENRQATMAASGSEGTANDPTRVSPQPFSSLFSPSHQS
uniref:Uncharacterized protein n=1 Tax=Oryza rufipogon TaxID=4529 RepID=A0A0E0REE5_ORYRU